MQWFKRMLCTISHLIGHEIDMIFLILSDYKSIKLSVLQMYKFWKKNR